MNAKKGGATAEVRRSAQAIEVYEKALKALGKKDHQKARELFESLVASYPEARDVVERALLYKAVCDRALDKRPAFRPKTVEEMLSYGVFLHNQGEFEGALKLFQQVLEQQPKNEHALYCAAASAARLGDETATHKSLRAAIQLSQANRAQARHDSDFEAFQDSDSFLALLDGPEEE
ncbi:MAG: tetratricopeptide repeat protein [Vicinamibacteria bacterium]